jgi:hypothetical protein
LTTNYLLSLLYNVWSRGTKAVALTADAQTQTLATMPFRVTRQILHDNKITLDIPPIKLLKGQVSVPLDSRDFKENKKNWDWTRLTNNDSSNNCPPHGNLKRFSPTLLALAIAAPPIATPKQWQEPNPPANDQHIRLYDY